MQRHIKSLLAIRKKWDISPDSQIQIERCDADLYIAKIGHHLESADFNGVYVKFGPSFDLRGFAPRELQYSPVVVTLFNPLVTLNSPSLKMYFFSLLWMGSKLYLVYHLMSLKKIEIYSHVTLVIQIISM